MSGIIETTVEFQEQFLADPQSILFEYAELYARISGIDFEKDVLAHLHDTNYWQADFIDPEKSTWGMSTRDAIRCLIDIQRTKQLFAGMKEVVQALRASGQERIIAIEAGIGTGILSILLTKLGIDTIYAIEINERTRNITGQFLDELGLTDQIHLVAGDATALEGSNSIPEGSARATILLSENLATGLFDEPQFQIIHHLSPFLADDVQILPFAADLSVSLGVGDWSTVPLKDGQVRTNYIARQVKGLRVLSERVVYGRVPSIKTAHVPVIKGKVELSVLPGVDPTVLLISTRFQINQVGKIHYLEADAAEFLGTTEAFQLPNGVRPVNGKITVDLCYQAGANSNRSLILTRDGHIQFEIPSK